MIYFLLLANKQGKIRLSKWYQNFTKKQKTKLQKEVVSLCLSRSQRSCNFIEWNDYKIIYRRYASLYFMICCDTEDNELIGLEIIHHFVEILDKYFGSVCELDIIFNFQKAYNVLDEVIIDGKLQDSSKKSILRSVGTQDFLILNAPETGTLNL
ncbi:ap-1 complex subunit sigma-2 [Anaeramoeba flamelloides]|uniref:AP complex subunit sigma n=2 Tax=Anaeramoeba flamelloides TaxID=1746091 RepID=A0AAV7YCG2_9EUKA|nr:ap-1 complex subunit sigma-2 [Anaeramoeba flamelloides]KAJ3427479.1 ap-1 complex subunit sigma-2 [Anaeramoeba flamelloides]KAJ3427493.1 ap-1 complex subunit sigma-2 [Anaeramoeba flamelloides]KAJ6228579.1 ap-1 complex subunit sigma-2 [Anaeramoeba flamelloides]KAJ6228592.1 ap-1 complex subunit sigma-2 [Anaeramoeba flamelloides]